MLGGNAKGRSQPLPFWASQVTDWSLCETGSTRWITGLLLFLHSVLSPQDHQTAVSSPRHNWNILWKLAVRFKNADCSHTAKLMCKLWLLQQFSIISEKTTLYLFNYYIQMNIFSVIFVAILDFFCTSHSMSSWFLLYWKFKWLYTVLSCPKMSFPSSRHPVYDCS